MENQTVAGPIDFHVIFPTNKFNVDQQLLVTLIPQYIFLCVQHKKEINTGLGQPVSQ